MKKLKKMARNPFFLPSGFTQQEIIDILENKGDNKRAQKQIAERKKSEKKIMKQQLFIAVQTSGLRPLIRAKKTMTKSSKKPDQIQRGLDLAISWGWGGIDRTYRPKVSSKEVIK